NHGERIGSRRRSEPGVVGRGGVEFPFALKIADSEPRGLPQGREQSFCERPGDEMAPVRNKSVPLTPHMLIRIYRLMSGNILITPAPTTASAAPPTILHTSRSDFFLRPMPKGYTFKLNLIVTSLLRKILGARMSSPACVVGRHLLKSGRRGRLR